MRFTSLPVWISILAIATVTLAQPPASVPREVADSWSHLIGHWKIEGHVGDTPITGSATFRWTEGKFCYLGEQTWQLGDTGRSIHLALIGGWDAGQQRTVEQGFSSSGSAATVRYRAPTQDGKLIAGEAEGTNGPNAPWSGTIKLEHNGPREFQLTTTIDGQLVHSLKYTRINDGPAASINSTSN